MLHGAIIVGGRQHLRHLQFSFFSPHPQLSLFWQPHPQLSLFWQPQLPLSGLDGVIRTGLHQQETSGHMGRQHFVCWLLHLLHISILLSYRRHGRPEAVSIRFL